LLPDDFKGGVKALNEKAMMYGRERFKYTTNSKDVERISVSIWDCKRIDFSMITLIDLCVLVK
jgi:ribosomal protein L37AE/L43A